MKTKILILSLLLICLVVVSCQPTPKVEPVVVEAKESPTIEAPIQTQPEEVAAVVEEPELGYDAKVNELLAKRNPGDNYLYFEQTTRLNLNQLYDTNEYEVYLKGNKIKKVYSDFKKLNKTEYYNIVYLDLDKKTATGICLKEGVICDGIGKKAYKLDFSKERLLYTPTQLLDELSYDAKVSGEEVLDSRKAIILKYKDASDNTVALSVDNYYILPLKEKTTNSDAKVIEEKRFSLRDVDGLRESDVSLPSGYELVVLS